MNKCFSLHLLFVTPNFHHINKCKPSNFVQISGWQLFAIVTSLGQQLIANLDLGSFSYGSDNATCVLVGEVIVV